MKPPVLLCYNLQGDKSSKVKLLAMRLMIRVRVVHAEEYQQTLAALCGYEPMADTQTTGAGFSDEMLVLGNFSSELINQFLIGFRQAKIQPVRLKAILTETNMHWDSIALHQQLAAEHDALANGRPPEHAQV